jgi:hypothetical protein
MLHFAKNKELEHSTGLFKSRYLFTAILTISSLVLAQEHPSKPELNDTSPAYKQNKIPFAELSTKRYVIGGITGSIVGFGVGHAIEHRYKSDRGWIFTAGEAGPIAIVAVGSIVEWMADSCNGDTSSEHYEECKNRDSHYFFSSPQTVTAALSIALGFKIWEIVDLWNHPHGNIPLSESNSSRAEFAIIPMRNEGLGAGLVLNF